MGDFIGQGVLDYAVIEAHSSTYQNLVCPLVVSISHFHSGLQVPSVWALPSCQMAYMVAAERERSGDVLSFYLPHLGRGTHNFSYPLTGSSDVASV